MARESENKDGVGSTPGGGSPSGRLLAALGLVVGLTAGGAVGVLLVGPMVAQRVMAAPGATVEEGEHAATDADGHGGGHGDEDGAASLHVMENLVVNPAGTQGTRFLVVTMALELDRPETAASLASRDAELRDALLRVLGSKTVAELSAVERREELKTELIETITGLLRSGEVRRIYFPQFVIQ